MTRKYEGSPEHKFNWVVDLTPKEIRELVTTDKTLERTDLMALIYELCQRLTDAEKHYNMSIPK